MSFDVRIAAVAAGQAWVFSRAQVSAEGGTQEHIRVRVARGQWSSPARGVYVMRGPHPTFEQRVWIAKLALGSVAVVSHEAAAALLQLPGFAPSRVVVTVPHPSHRRVFGATVHQSRLLPDRHVQRTRGLPVTTVPRTLVDLAAFLSTSKLARAVDDAIGRQHTSYTALAGCFADLARPGRRGVQRMGEVLQKHAPGEALPASELEWLLLRALTENGLPRPELQFPFPGRRAVAGCVDAAYPDVRLILEADGRRWHGRTLDMQHDRWRDNEAARVGWQTLRFLWEMLVQDPAQVADTVRDTRRRRAGHAA